MSRSLWLGRVAISAGVQSRGWNGANPTWLGFAYGAWLPRIRRSGFSGMFAYWLCFHASVDVWPRSCGIRGIGLR